MIMMVLNGCSLRMERELDERLFEMQDHERDALTAVDAVLAKDLGAAKQAGKRLAAKDKVPMLPPESVGHLEAVRLAGESLSRADTLVEAAKGIVEVTGRCAACHAEYDVATPVLVEAAPEVRAWEALVWQDLSRWEGALAELPGLDGDASSWVGRRTAFATYLGATVQGDNAQAPAGNRTASEVEMTEHWLAAFKALNATIAGDVEEARASGKLLTAQLGAMTPVPLEAQKQAEALGGAADVAAAAESFTQMTAACGSCHAATDGGPDAEDPPDWLPEGHMARHYWGVSYVWMGMLSNSDSMVKEGADILVNQEAVHPPAATAAHAKDLDADIHVIGKRIQDAQTPGDLQKGLSDLIVGCAACHSQQEGALGGL